MMGHLVGEVYVRLAPEILSAATPYRFMSISTSRLQAALERCLKLHQITYVIHANALFHRQSEVNEGKRDLLCS